MGHSTLFSPVHQLDTRFRRHDGPEPSGPVYFLPWHVDFEQAMRIGLIATPRWQSCYELPEAIVCHVPAVCASAIRRLADDVARHLRPELVIGFSMGTVPATYVAATLGCRLWSFASADRGELMLWSSPRVREVRARAEALDFGVDDFADSLHGLNPEDCIERVHPDSRLVSGIFDRYIPRARSAGLVRRARSRLAADRILRLPLGHSGVLLASRWLQRRWLAER